MESYKVIQVDTHNFNITDYINSGRHLDHCNFVMEVLAIDHTNALRKAYRFVPSIDTYNTEVLLSSDYDRIVKRI